jgi:hypothetical protein
VDVPFHNFWNHPDININQGKVKMPLQLQQERIQLRIQQEEEQQQEEQQQQQRHNNELSSMSFLRQKAQKAQKAKNAKKLAVPVGGSTLVGKGTVLLFTPAHPVGHLVQAGGVGVLTTEYDIMKKQKVKAGDATKKSKAKATQLWKTKLLLLLVRGGGARTATTATTATTTATTATSTSTHRRNIQKRNKNDEEEQLARYYKRSYSYPEGHMTQDQLIQECLERSSQGGKS